MYHLHAKGTMVKKVDNFDFLQIKSQSVKREVQVRWTIIMQC